MKEIIMEKAKTIERKRFIDELLAILREESFRDPMYDEMKRGQVSRAAMKRWTIQAMFVVRDFTRFISAIHSNCPHTDGQMLLAENLWEEHGKGDASRTHLALIKSLAKSLGATDEELDRAEPLPETSNYIAHCFKVTREKSFIEGMAAIGLGIEYFSPRFFCRACRDAAQAVWPFAGRR